MSTIKQINRLSWLVMIPFFLLLSALAPACLLAGDPHSAYYSADTDKLFWFIHVSDVHIGSDDQDSRNLQWLVSQAKTVINPSFIVVTGDLTDSTNGNIFGYPNGPYQEEWAEYANILRSNGVDATFYYDIPGNHDAYNDRYFTYYLHNSIQGRATGKAQLSWTRTFPFGTYHFLGVNTADNTGDSFSIFWPYGDYAGLDQNELAFISDELSKNSNANLTLVFGHHPLASTGSIFDTYLYYGKDQFVSLMDSYRASLYGYGHLHSSSEKFYAQYMREGIFYSEAASLGESDQKQFTVMAIDCNGLSSVAQTINTWPAVLITAPMNRRLGSVVNPYAYTVPDAAANPIRALVFDPNAVTQVQYRVDRGAWQTMTNIPDNPSLWTGTWDASRLVEGEHTLNVKALTGSGSQTDSIAVYVKPEHPRPPAAPSNLIAAAASSSRINPSWRDNANNEEGFRIERCQGSTCTDFAEIAAVGPKVTAYNDTGLGRATTYRYRVRAYNAGGNSAYSNIASAQTRR
jgi:hypothetical protein